MNQEENVTSLIQHLQDEAVTNQLVTFDVSECVTFFEIQFQSTFRNFLILNKELYNPENSVWTIIGVNASSPGLPRLGGWWLASSGPGEFDDPFFGAQFASTPPLIPVSNCTLDTNTTCTTGGGTTGVTPEYCLAEQAPENNTVGISIGFLVFVIIANALKAGTLLFGIFKNEFEPIATTGDAISSFLSRPDATTTGLGPLSVMDVGVTGFSTNMGGVTRSVRKKPYRWYKAPEPFRWYLGTMR